MKNLKQLSIILLLGMFVFTANKTMAQSKPCSGKSEKCELEKVIPNLTVDQTKKIKELKTIHEKEALKLKNDLNIKGAELKALKTAENADMKAINKKIEERSILRTQLEKSRTKSRQDIRNLLNDEQKLAFDKNMDKESKRKDYHKRDCSKPCSKEAKVSCCSKSKK